MSGPEADYREQFFEVLERARKQVAHLEYSLNRVRQVEGIPEAERLERYEALTARFSRLQDTLIAPFREIAFLELEPDKNNRLVDLLNFMEKLEIIESVSHWHAFRRTRNAIAHEYWDDPERVKRLLNEVEVESQMLIATVGRLEQYGQKLLQAQSTGGSG